MTKKKNGKQPIPEWAFEGSKLEAARKKALASDKKYTQAYMAGLVKQDQGIWHQWHKGLIRILDEYWLVFANELGFDPFETRPELRKIQGLLDRASKRELSVEEMIIALPDDAIADLVFRVALDLPKERKIALVETLARSL